MIKKDIYCPTCNSREARKTFERIDRKIVFRCDNCGHLFANLTDKDLDKIYEESYFVKNSNGLGVGYENYDYRPTIDFYWQAKLVQTVCDNNKYLDVGCATGKTLELTRLLGVESYGVEFSKYASAVAKSKGLDVFNGKIEDYKKNKDFSVISLWEVVEHVFDPVMLLNAAKKLLDDNGWILISVPDATSKDSEWSGYKQSLEHISYFTEESLSYLLGSIFGEGNFIVRPYTDGVSSTLVGIAKKGNPVLSISDLENIINLKASAKNIDQKILKFSMLKGLSEIDLAKSYFEKNLAKESSIMAPERDIVEGLNLLIMHRLDEAKAPSLAQSLAFAKRVDSPFWECYGFSFSENYFFNKNKYSEKLNNLNLEKEYLQKTLEGYKNVYEDVISSKGWRAILIIRKLLRRK